MCMCVLSLSTPPSPLCVSPSIVCVCVKGGLTGCCILSPVSAAEAYLGLSPHNQPLHKNLVKTPLLCQIKLSHSIVLSKPGLDWVLLLPRVPYLSCTTLCAVRDSPAQMPFTASAPARLLLSPPVLLACLPQMFLETKLPLFVSAPSGPKTSHNMQVTSNVLDMLQ